MSQSYSPFPTINVLFPLTLPANSESNEPFILSLFSVKDVLDGTEIVTLPFTLSKSSFLGPDFFTYKFTSPLTVSPSREEILSTRASNVPFTLFQSISSMFFNDTTESADTTSISNSSKVQEDGTITTIFFFKPLRSSLLLASAYWMMTSSPFLFHLSFNSSVRVPLSTSSLIERASPLYSDTFTVPLSQLIVIFETFEDISVSPTL